jgi:hypothetical protein
MRPSPKPPSRLFRNITIVACVVALFWLWEGSNFFFGDLDDQSHDGIFHSVGTVLNQVPPFTPKFPPYHGGDTKQLSPSWILTSPDVSTVHRFFDTSPFSPSGRYVGVTRMSIKENRDVYIGDTAEIVVMDLFTGKSSVCANTTAWDSQVGAHVQWGKNDNELFYNVIRNTSTGLAPKGIILNMFTNAHRELDCPVYQVSPSGLYSASPDLTTIKYTQLGYGVFVPHTQASTDASKTKGLYLTDLTTGKCRLLVSLFDIAKFANIPTDVPMYGFHTKWSSDGTMIMFVVRTLTSSTEGGFSSLIPTAPKKARINHMFVVSATGEILTHVVSWGSACGLLPARKYGDRTTHIVGDIVVRGDGNHPNWIPDSHNISVNYRQTCDYPSTSSVGSVPVWKIAVFDVDALMKDKKHPTDSFEATSKSVVAHHSNVLRGGYISYPFGTGHPTYLPGGRYAIVDAYLKEQRMFGASLSNAPGHEGLLPLRLVDLLTQKEVWLMEVT